MGAAHRLCERPEGRPCEQQGQGHLAAERAGPLRGAVHQRPDPMEGQCEEGKQSG